VRCIDNFFIQINGDWICFVFFKQQAFSQEQIFFLMFVILTRYFWLSTKGTSSD
jgi:hypothetical protein